VGTHNHGTFRTDRGATRARARVVLEEITMSLSRRHVLSLGAAFGAGAALPAWAQGKPLFETLNMFVPAAPGGG
jgi:hypothetical protein